MGTQLRDTNGNLLYRTELDYDTQNRLVGFGETASGQNYKTAYTYDSDNRITSMTFDGGNAISVVYPTALSRTARMKESLPALTSTSKAATAMAALRHWYKRLTSPRFRSSTPTIPEATLFRRSVAI